MSFAPTRAPKQNAPSGPSMEGALHDVTNAVAAARSYGEILLLRAKSGNITNAQTLEDSTALLESMLRELERVGDIVRTVRGGVIEAYQPGDVLACADCGYTFVHRKAAGKLGSCRRCKSYQVTRWKPEATG